MHGLARLRERFWFTPALMCVAAVVLAEGLILLDRSGVVTSAPGWLQPVLHRVGESGSRDILGAIAGSSLAVAGTTFSITMAVLALTSSTYGPRLIRNFMTDRGNQAVLGVFVSTFLYALLVLRSIRAIGDPGDPDADVFVPHLAVNVAVLLGIVDVMVLVYFIHHISDSIQVSTIARRVRTELQSAVGRCFPDEQAAEQTGDGAEGEVYEALARPGDTIAARSIGYVTAIDRDELVSLAGEADVILDVLIHEGSYVLADSPLCRAHPAGRLPAKLADKVRSAVTTADSRSPYQDVDFAVQQLIELAVRALSPGTNDPFTAINALDDLSSGLADLAGRPAPPVVRTDSDGRPRLRSTTPDAVDLTSSVLDHMRWYAADHPTVVRACLTLAERVAERTEDQGLRARLLSEVRLLVEAFETAGHLERDIEAMQDRARTTERVFAGAETAS